MSLLSGLSATLTPATQAATAYAQGKADKRKAEESSTLAMLDQLRKAQEAAEVSAERQARIQNYRSLAEERLKPTNATPRKRTQYDAERGVMVDLDSGEAAPIKNLPPRPERPAPSGPAPDRTLVPVQDPETGTVTYVPREQAIGMQAPSAAARGSASLKQAVSKNTEQLSVIEDALKELQANPQAVGLKRAVGDLPLMGGVADYINQRNDPSGVGARAQLANIGSLIIHDRSGAAVTVSEFPRLAPFVPRVGDTPDVIRTKLAKLRQNIEILNSELNSQLGVTPGGKPALAERVAQLRAEGKTKEQARTIVTQEGYKVP